MKRLLTCNRAALWLTALCLGCATVKEPRAEAGQRTDAVPVKRGDDALSPRVRELVDRGLRGAPWGSFAGVRFEPRELDEIEARVLARPDVSSYLLLDALRARSKPRYDEVPPGVRAKILCSALANFRTLNAFEPLPNAADDGSSLNPRLPMYALVNEAGVDAALTELLPLLDDRRAADFSGSADATASEVEQYRRCDFAHRACSIILGEAYRLNQDLVDRDAELARVKAAVKRRLGADGPSPSTRPVPR